MSGSISRHPGRCIARLFRVVRVIWCGAPMFVCLDYTLNLSPHFLPPALPLPLSCLHLPPAATPPPLYSSKPQLLHLFSPNLKSLRPNPKP